MCPDYTNIHKRKSTIHLAPDIGGRLALVLFECSISSKTSSLHIRSRLIHYRLGKSPSPLLELEEDEPLGPAALLPEEQSRVSTAPINDDFSTSREAGLPTYCIQMCLKMKCCSHLLRPRLSLHEDCYAMLYLHGSLESAPPVRPERIPVLFDVEVEVEPAWLDEDCRGSNVDPVLAPSGAAIARDDRRVARRMEICILAGGSLMRIVVWWEKAMRLIRPDVGSVFIPVELSYGMSTFRA